jgi:nucleoside-diphosphate-sugar epimerase
MLVTVVGARGFVGSRVSDVASAAGHTVIRLRHEEALSAARPLGTVIYCSGLAWGAESRPLEAYRLHAEVVLRILESGRHDRFVFLSSTKVYERSASTSESSAVATCPESPADFYTGSKIAGETLTLAASLENRVIRLSNVFGPSTRSQLFLSDVLRQAVTKRRIVIRTALRSSKDYVWVDDAAAAIVKIAHGSKERIYNVAAGTNTSHGEIIEAIRSLLPVDVEVSPSAPTVVTPSIDTRRIQSEFPFAPRHTTLEMGQMIEAFRADARTHAQG